MSHAFFVTALGIATKRASVNSPIFLSIAQCLQVFSHDAPYTDTKVRVTLGLKRSHRLGHSIAQTNRVSQPDSQKWQKPDHLPLVGEVRQLVMTPKECPSISKTQKTKKITRETEKTKKTTKTEKTTKTKTWYLSSLKALRASPSASLEDALACVGHHHDIPGRSASKRDLSYSAADWMRPLQRERLLQREECFDGIRPTQLMRYFRFTSYMLHLQKRSSRLSLPIILINYLRDAHSLVFPMRDRHADRISDRELSPRILAAFNQESLAYLAARGYDGTDVMAWAWIIMAKTSERSLWRLLAIASTGDRPYGVCERIPTFVFLFILRKRYISAEALRLCLVHAWDRLENRATTISSIGSKKLAGRDMEQFGLARKENFLEERSRSPTQMDEKSIVVMVVRLLRHARQVWFPAVINISHMLSAYVDGRGGINEPPKGELGVKKVVRLTSIYNRVLSLLSQPPFVNPFLSVPYQQQAQFHLLKRMAEFQPPLPINEEGYRGLTRVQLAHKKTSRERDWAGLKAKSWPPWKAERTGLDVEKGPEYGTSRAQKVVTQMKESGYSSGRWGDVAGIYAGWDTDGSPTIQTRTILSTKRENNLDAEEGDAVWAARIRSTRTLNEAWACFLAYGDTAVTQSQAVYQAMFEKLVFSGKRQRKSTKRDSAAAEVVVIGSDLEVLPGDGKEVFPDPISPSEVTFVRSQPPSTTEFCRQMSRIGVRPSEQFLSLILGHAESLESGLLCFYTWGTSGRKLAEALANPQLVNFSEDSLAGRMIREMPYRTFLGLIRLLCGFPNSLYPIAHSSLPVNPDPSHGRIFAGMTSSPSNPLVQAARLVLFRNPEHLPPWISLLRALAQPTVTLGSPDVRDTDGDLRQLHDILTWKAIVQVVHRMRDRGLVIDSEGFRCLCIGLEKAVRACHMVEIPAAPLSRVRVGAEAVLAEGPRVVHLVFNEWVGVDVGLKSLDQVSSYIGNALLHWEQDERLRIPTLLATPLPAALHAYVRVMGLLGDYEGILALVQWMARHDEELRTVDPMNGRRIRRRALIAARIFIERDTNEREDRRAVYATRHFEALDTGRYGLLKQLRATMESMDAWGGWPTDDEVINYHKEGN